MLQQGRAPLILMVGPRLLYNGNHIRGSKFVGPAGSEPGRVALLQEVGAVPKDSEIVIYCGCCPMQNCPNIRPAFQTLSDAGYRAVKVLIIPTNLHADWTGKGYPVEKGDVPK